MSHYECKVCFERYDDCTCTKGVYVPKGTLLISKWDNKDCHRAERNYYRGDYVIRPGKITSHIDNFIWDSKE